MSRAQSCADLDILLAQARSGDAESRGLLLDRYRNYLNLLARTMMGEVQRLDLEASDLVQQTFLEAHRDLSQFHGTGEPALTAWLRQILIHNLAHESEYRDRRKRGGKQRVSLDRLLERSGQLVHRVNFQPEATPSEHAILREQSVLLADALASLPEDQRTALELHHLHGLSVPEVSREMGRSLLSATSLIFRGMKALRGSLSPAV